MRACEVGSAITPDAARRSLGLGLVGWLAGRPAGWGRMKKAVGRICENGPGAAPLHKVAGLIRAGQRPGTDTHSPTHKVVRDAAQKHLLRPTIWSKFRLWPRSPVSLARKLLSEQVFDPTACPAASCRYAACWTKLRVRVCLAACWPRTIESGTRRTKTWRAQSTRSAQHPAHSAALSQLLQRNTQTQWGSNSPGVPSGHFSRLGLAGPAPEPGTCQVLVGPPVSNTTASSSGTKGWRLFWTHLHPFSLLRCLMKPRQGPDRWDLHSLFPSLSAGLGNISPPRAWVGRCVVSSTRFTNWRACRLGRPRASDAQLGDGDLSLVVHPLPCLAVVCPWWVLVEVVVADLFGATGEQFSLSRAPKHAFASTCLRHRAHRQSKVVVGKKRKERGGSSWLKMKPRANGANLSGTWSEAWPWHRRARLVTLCRTWMSRWPFCALGFGPFGVSIW